MIKVGIAGIGTVGSGVVEVIQTHQSEGEPIRITKILEKNRNHAFVQTLDNTHPEWFANSLEEFVQSSEVDVIVETIGEPKFARALIESALTHKKHVVSANKDLFAVAGKELLELAQNNGVMCLFEASVAGAIPVIRLIQDYFSSKDLLQIRGIMNGTTNYILSAMDQAQLSFEVALQQAQELGFAEQDPTNDIKGYDARYKLVIVIWLVTKTWLPVEEITVEGIDHLQKPDFEYAQRRGRQIKLISYVKVLGTSLQAFVLPVMLPSADPISKISGSTNIIALQGRFSDEIAITGKGAGSLPTASAIVADLYKILRSQQKTHVLQEETQYELLPFSEYEFKHTLRFTVKDDLGIVGRIGTILGKYGISIYAVEQLPQYHQKIQPIIFTLTLESCEERIVQNAIQEINQLEFMEKPVSLLRELMDDHSQS